MGELSARLVADGHKLTVLTTDAFDHERLWNPHGRRLATPAEDLAGIRVLRFPLRYLPLAPYSYTVVRLALRLFSSSGLVPTNLLQRVARYAPWTPDLWHWLESTSESFDIIGGMMILHEPFLEAGLCLARRCRVPFVVYPLTHLGAGTRPGGDVVSRYYTMRHQMAVVRASDAVMAQTAVERDFYLAHGTSAERIVVAGPGVEPERVLGGDGERFRLKYALSGPIVAFLGAMTYDKGAVSLVQAGALAGRRFDLVLAGSADEPFRRLVHNLPIEAARRVHLLGAISEDEKRDLLAACDVLAIPSRTDSFGITYLEAWLYRKPVIAARAWGMSDVIDDGRDGLLVPFGDASALAQALGWLLDHPMERAAMGLRGEQKVYARHTWELVYSKVRAVYGRLSGSG